MYKLIIVDDEPLTRNYIKANAGQLSEHWECVGEAGDGEEALAVIDGLEHIDLVITDIKMPGMSGLELARQLSERRDRPHIIILSGYDEFAMAKEAMAYGVNDYLLKPIVNEELASVLNKLALRLVAEASDRAAIKTLQALSEQSREDVARNFLRAIAYDNNSEIRMLYPILHRLKLSLLEAEGAMLVVELDGYAMLERDISPSDYALYRYIVHQTAMELAEAETGTIAFIDNEERTVMLVPGDDADDVGRRCDELFRRLSGSIVSMTGLRLWGARGSSELDVLQLGVSYRRACRTLKHSVFAAPLSSAELLADNTNLDERVRQLDKDIASMQGALHDNNEVQLHTSLLKLMKAEDPVDRTGLLRLGVYMLAALAVNSRAGERMIAQEAVHRSLKQLKQRCTAAAYQIEDAAQLLREVLEPLYGGYWRNAEHALQENSGKEHDIVTKVKDYILAHYSEPLSLALIAEKMNMSSGYLSSLFHSNTGESYIKFLTRVRMEHAASLLRTKPDEKVYDVADKAGYTSVKHFSYVFKQHFGMPPGEYQEKSRR
ncbi:response regulator [Paenibacillus sp. J5C_2022]|uniref:response regulator transcription factor n=1 Tax=Paenibacillus sp. J5C2022 TaxID=2977129 RepID=UPI0021D3D700|nr:response regulator [Paenibacillus sp. J5C2022]MCU6711324.1 response regulator [Paenibacillus sp. J5C2022]